MQSFKSPFRCMNGVFSPVNRVPWTEVIVPLPPFAISARIFAIHGYAHAARFVRAWRFCGTVTWSRGPDTAVIVI